MTKNELPLRLSATTHTPQSATARDINMQESEQSTSRFTPKHQLTVPRDLPQESRELQEATTHLNATLDRSNSKMQNIIDKTRAQLPEQARTPAPSRDCGCGDELYATSGCQCYATARSQIASLTATLSRGLKRKVPEREAKADDKPDKVDSKCDETEEELRSREAGGEAGSWLKTCPSDRPLFAADPAEQKMLQRYLDDASQIRRQIIPLTRGSSQQREKTDQSQERLRDDRLPTTADQLEQRMLQRHPDDVSPGKRYM